MNGIPLVVVEAKITDPNMANPMYAAYEQLLRYRDGREQTRQAGLREGEPRLFHTNLLMVRTCGEVAEFGTISSGEEHFYAWKDIWPEEKVQKHSMGSTESKASEMEHAIRKHCTVHFDEDPAFYKRLSEKPRLQGAKGLAAQERSRVGRVALHRSFSQNWAPGSGLRQ